MAANPIIRSMLDLVFPASCMLCLDRSMSQAGLICDSCQVGIEKEGSIPTCPTCGSSVGAFQVVDGRCAICRKHSTRVAGTARVGAYTGMLGQFFRSYKYRRQWSCEAVLTDLMERQVTQAAWISNIDAIVAVPTHWMRRITKDVYPADAFAISLARRLRIPLAPVLKRVRGGRHQIGLSYTQRLANVKGAFALRRGVGLNGAKLLLVDDVKTTGATLNECAKILRQNGASAVYAAVLLQAGWQPGSHRYLDVA